jgi:tetratricopeptide (TPR) repeat protein
MLFRAVVAAALLALGACVTESELDPGPPPPQIPDAYERGMDRFGRGAFQEAIDAFTQAIGERPDWAPAYVMRGNAYQKITDTAQARWTESQYAEAAIADYTKAIQLDPGDPEPWFHRAISYRVLRRSDMAVRDLLHLTENVAPRSSDPHRLLAVIYEEDYDGLEREALRHYQAYVRNGGKDPQVRSHTLALQDRLGPLEEPAAAPSEERERRAAELFGRYGSAFAQGNRPSAQRALEELMEKYGDTKFVEPMRDVLRAMLEDLKRTP